ncbi:MAG: hypothetical protein U9N45_04585, partial [Gemmatimonadota bacterium]|nr:hypothetical protein [Gemmatimonadota bacterium]
ESGCSGDSPLAPAVSAALPVESSRQLEGRWGDVNMFAQGLPVTAYLIPAFAKGSFDSRLHSYESDLVVSVTGEKTGLFSVEASGVAADTVDITRIAQGLHRFWGSFAVGDDGALDITLRTGAGDIVPSGPAYSGSAVIAGDTLIISFTLSSPPHKRVDFLPSTTSFLARMVKRRQYN